MDRIKCQNLQTVIEFNKPQLLKKALQFLLSLSVFFFLFSYSLTSSFFVHSFIFYFSTFSFQIFDHTIERKYMFLLCIVILILLARDSGLITSSSPLETADFHDEFRSRNRDDDLQEVLKLSEKKASASEEEVVVGGNGCLIAEEEEENGHLIAGESSFLTAAKEEEEEEEEEEEAEENGWISTEKLNKKFDDFIRRMKEEIKTEAKQQPVMVYSF